jgi:hypothetical protein
MPSTATYQSESSLSSSSWKIEGDYFEGCNCDLICPCIFMADPDEGFCDVILAWHINRGTFDNIILDDLNVVAFFHTPGNMLTGPKWKVVMYIDQQQNSWMPLLKFTPDNLAAFLKQRKICSEKY